MPQRVCAEESFGEDGADAAAAALFPEEAEAVARAVPKRRREFARVRVCARTALGRLGLPPVPLVPGHRGAPRWPEGVVGSMTHCAGYVAAAVAPSTETAGLGIDAEPDEPLPAGVLEAVSLPEERELLRSLSASHPGVHWDRLLFSAKESVFKAWYPLTSRELDFSEAEITIAAEAPREGTFHARLLVEGTAPGGRRLRSFDGRWAARSALVVTAVHLAAGPETGAGASEVPYRRAEPAG
nr:4'-phosphopantetheinyl transferase superfamily protein [Streptomyces sp. HNM0575]